jgi:hypothetical protein
MPRPPIRPVIMPDPAFLGLNKQKRGAPLPPSWCIEAQNAVFDTQGRLAARKGWTQLTTSPLAGTPNIGQVFEYVQEDGDTFIVSSTVDKLYSGTTTLTDVTGSLVFTSSAWQFMNFNGLVYGVQQGEAPIQWNGAGNFAAVAVNSGTQPDGNAGVAAFGRLWIVDDDYQTIRYSALLDPTRWDAADGGGVLDMSEVWTNGTDQVIAITSYGSALVVFGKRHVVIWTDGAGSDIGLEPETMYVGEVIEGIGCVARDTVQRIGEVDVVFWSASGVRSLRRVLQEKATPVNDVSANNREYVAAFQDSSSAASARSVYSPKEGFYLLYPGTNSERVFCFDVRQPLEDGTFRLLEWPMFEPTAMASRLTGEVLFGFPGVIGQYAGYDDDDASYRWVWQSPWMDLGDASFLKFLKELKALVYTPGDYTVICKWYVDFNSTPSSAQTDLDLQTAYQYNVDEFEAAEYGAAGAQRNIRFPLSKECQYASVRLEVEIDGHPFALQSTTIFARPGRLA